MSSTTLAIREARAQTGVLQFAEEMQAIRDEKLYPNAGKKDAWKTYCKERWGMSEDAVSTTLLAAPVLKRLLTPGVARSEVSVTAAAAVATLPEKVQDAILSDAPKRDVVKARAKAARKVQKKAVDKGVAPDPAVMIAAAKAAKPSKPVPKVTVPEELRDENLPPKLTPEDHACAPRRLAGDSLIKLWQANQKLKDTVLDFEDREVTEEKLERLITLARMMLGALRGEGAISDDDLSELLEGAI